VISPDFIAIYGGPNSPAAQLIPRPRGVDTNSGRPILERSIGKDYGTWPMSELNDLTQEFLAESHEGLDRLERDLIALEENPADAPRVAEAFRCVHTLKGTCGFFGFAKLETLAHAGESLLVQLRDGRMQMNGPIATALLAMADALRHLLHQIAQSGGEGHEEHGRIIAALKALGRGRCGGERRKKAGDRAEISQGAQGGQNKAAPAMGGFSSGAIRVDVLQLDRLMSLVGELVLARNQITQLAAAQEESGLAGASQRLNLLTTQLQEGVMKTRMQPIDRVWSNLPRLVRDLSKSQGKKLRVQMEGSQTEMDRTLLEAIRDPLTHVVRNAVDHGIETPEGRKAAGKPEEGRLLLRAFHEGGQVHVEISDDGGGVAIEKVKAQAVQRCLISAERAAGMSDEEAIQLIFHPGLSTAQTVTRVSGRGVGMDVVKTNVEKIGGTVQVQSQPGQGTLLRIRVPLTLAILPALIVRSGTQRLAIARTNLLELLCLDAQRIRRDVHRVGGAPLLRLRGRLLPLLHLGRLLGGPAASGELAAPMQIVVLQAGDPRFGLVVDDIQDTQEIMVKPLGKRFKSIPCYAGATILGNGKVALILDVMGLARQGRILEHQNPAAPQIAAAPPAPVQSEAARPGSRRQRLLLFQSSRQRRMAVDLSQVSRLEEFAADRIEAAGNHQAVQYRGRIMPLIQMADILPGRRHGAAAAGGGPTPVQVIVHCRGGRDIGLVVEKILDIVDEPVTLQAAPPRPGLLGTAIIQQKVTELIDMAALARQAGIAEPSSAAAVAA
jgi:two-component system, chemotaxis family, sensor kinase CheA